MVLMDASARDGANEQARLRRSKAIRDLGFILVGLPLSVASPTCIAVVLLLLRHKYRSTVFDGNTTLAVIIGVVLPIVLLLALIPALTAAQRWRLSSFASTHLQGPAHTAEVDRTRRLRAWLGAPETWRQLGYHLVVGPVVEVGGLIAVGVLALGLSLCTAFFWISTVSGTHPIQVRVVLTLLGVALGLVSPWALRAARWVDTRLGSSLLGPNRTERLLSTVTESRSGLVAAADAERRRIERDLHDGAQARLVSLAMSLGLARATRTDLPEDAKALIADAHDEATKAIDELRHLIRGLHPAVLDDLGLDAALSGLAAGMPLPVNLHVNVSQRPCPAIEAVAYFVVSEALANTAKHARASRVDIAVERVGSTLRIVVADDGIGGADPTHGSGLNGLSQRVRAVDGTFRICSPPGGPTTVEVALPCES